MAAKKSKSEKNSFVKFAYAHPAVTVAVSVIVIIAIIVSIVITVLGGKNKVPDWDEVYSAAGVPTEEAPADFTARFIDVGQGDCSLFVSGDKTMLIDCGEKEYSDTVIGEIKSLGISKLDYVVATHGHSDHIGSMPDVMNAFTVSNIIMSESSATSSVYEDFLDAADASGANIIKAVPDYTFSFGEASCKVLAPIEYTESDENDNSVVMLITYGETSFLMMGDASKNVEEDILAKYPNLSADILKVGHHGSKTSSSENFIDEVFPETSIISVGAGNRYKHPADKTLQTLTNYGSKIYRTDKNGTVTVSTNGKTYNVLTEK